MHSVWSTYSIPYHLLSCRYYSALLLLLLLGNAAQLLVQLLHTIHLIDNS